MIQYEPQEKQMSVTLCFCYDLPTILRVSKRELVSLGYTHSYDEVFHDGSRLTKVNLIYFARLHRQTQANE